MVKRALYLLLAAVLLAVGAAQAEMRYVGKNDPLKTIQAAIDAAAKGDTIVVRDGLYAGAGNCDVDFAGKAVTLRSESGPDKCIIDCRGSARDPHRGFIFHRGEGVASVLDGFTIINGSAQAGGGICCVGASPLIKNNVLLANTAAAGGAIFCTGSSPTIVNNEIAANDAASSAGICIAGTAGPIPQISGNVITGNSADTAGGLGCRETNALVTGNVIAANDGGGILCAARWPGALSPTLVANAISANAAPALSGGGIAISGCAAIAVANTITANTALAGGGVLCSAAGGIVANNLIAGNDARQGGGVCIENASERCVFINNTLTANNAADCGGAIACRNTAAAIVNCILFGDTAADGPELALLASPGPSTLAVRYSCVAGRGMEYVEPGCTLNWFTGAIDADPLFADPANGDFHLKSKAGRWSPSENGGQGGWVSDARTSPCVDMGDPSSGFSREPSPNGTRINLGADGNTPEASKGTTRVRTVPGDANGDNVVDKTDMEAVRGHINQKAADADNWKYDVNGDGKIDVLDMIYIRNHLPKDKEEKTQKK